MQVRQEYINIQKKHKKQKSQTAVSAFLNERKIIMKILTVIDMQNDFVTGSLGSDAAKKIVPRIAEKLRNYDGKVIFTRDTHDVGYLKTQEGTRLPVPHCIKGTDGRNICDALAPYADTVVDKPSFGSTALPEVIKSISEAPDEIEICGLCTDICVISNAMILKAFFPETRITVDSSCCAGVTEKSHQTALDAMAAVQIDIL